VLTNDSRFAAWLTDPANALPRVYEVTVRPGMSEAEVAALDERIDAHRELSWANTRTNAYLGALATLISGLGTVFVITYGASLVGRGQLTVGELLAFYALIAQLYSPIVRLTQFQATAVATRVSVERLFEIFDEPEPVAPP